MLTRCIICSLLFAGISFAAAPTTHYVCHQSATPVKLDGHLDDAAWQNAEWTSDFADITGDPAAPKAKFRTRAKMLWTGTYFYIAMELVEPNVFAAMKDHDAPLFKENAIEIFLDPDGDERNYAEIQANALGTVMELVMDKTYREKGKPRMDWDAPGMKIAVHVQGTVNDASDKDSGWTAEVAIPFTSLKDLDVTAPPKAGDTWRLNLSRVYRETKESKSKFWTWAPQGEVNMHVPAKWGVVKFEK